MFILKLLQVNSKLLLFITAVFLLLFAQFTLQNKLHASLCSLQSPNRNRTLKACFGSESKKCFLALVLPSPLYFPLSQLLHSASLLIFLSACRPNRSLISCVFMYCMSLDSCLSSDGGTIIPPWFLLVSAVSGQINLRQDTLSG